MMKEATSDRLLRVVRLATRCNNKLLNFYNVLIITIIINKLLKGCSGPIVRSWCRYVFKLEL